MQTEFCWLGRFRLGIMCYMSQADPDGDLFRALPAFKLPRTSESRIICAGLRRKRERRSRSCVSTTKWQSDSAPGSRRSDRLRSTSGPPDPTNRVYALEGAGLTWRRRHNARESRQRQHDRRHRRCPASTPTGPAGSELLGHAPCISPVTVAFASERAGSRLDASAEDVEQQSRVASPAGASIAGAERC